MATEINWPQYSQELIRQHSLMLSSTAMPSNMASMTKCEVLGMLKLQATLPVLSRTCCDGRLLEPKGDASRTFPGALSTPLTLVYVPPMPKQYVALLLGDVLVHQLCVGSPYAHTRRTPGCWDSFVHSSFFWLSADLVFSFIFARKSMTHINACNVTNSKVLACNPQEKLLRRILNHFSVDARCAAFFDDKEYNRVGPSAPSVHKCDHGRCWRWFDWFVMYVFSWLSFL